MRRAIANWLKEKLKAKCDYQHICSYNSKCDQEAVAQSSEYGFSYCGEWRGWKKLKKTKNNKLDF